MPVNITPETFYDLTLQLSRIVQNTYLGEATATSSSSDDNIITDTNNDQVAGYYANTIYQGTAWLPAQGTFHLITAHTLNTLTISPSATTPVASGEDYYAAPPFFPLQVLKHSINRALYSIGKIELVTSVTAVADQETYTSTDNAAFGEEISHIHMASATSAPYNYNEVFGWDQEEDRTFRWRYNSIPHTAYPMRITYKTYSTELVDADDEIAVTLAPERVIWTAAVHALRWKIQQTKQDDPTYISLLNEAQIKAAQLAVQYPTDRTPTIKFSRFS